MNAMKIEFIATCLGCWGKGDTVNEAIENMRSVGGSTKKFVVYAFPKIARAAVLDAYGTVGWHTEDKAGRQYKRVSKRSRDHLVFTKGIKKKDGGL